MQSSFSAHLRTAHAEIRAHFVAPGAQVPELFDDAMSDALWAALVRARAASNQFHARQAARRAGLSIHHASLNQPGDSNVQAA